ncbi:MAG: tRNA pseudouridine(55) synthase TruB [Clostridia bacterium]|nr:tRNA pseudouridine(55) synthase TruB [Clostridia bacterium]
MDGIFLIDKPQNFTSFDVVAKMKGILRTKKIGHAGTLDPMATGVLPLLVGKATRAMEILPCSDKEYIAGFRLGTVTDTLDIWGKVISENEDFDIDEREICDKLKCFTGEIEQIPPMYSAMQKDGVRLYDLARKGIEVDRPAKKVFVYNLELLTYDKASGEGQLKVKCSKGTFVRTIISDLGSALGCGAVMISLRRTMAVGFSEKDCITLEESQRLRNENKIETALIPTENAFLSYGKVKVTGAQARRFINGGELSLDRVSLPDSGVIFRVCFGDTFLGLGKVKGSDLAVYRMFYSGGAGFENN